MVRGVCVWRGVSQKWEVGSGSLEWEWELGVGSCWEWERGVGRGELGVELRVGWE